MKTIIRLKWAIIALWVIAAVVLTIFMPNLNYIINERGNATIDKSYPSQVAQDMINSMSDEKGDTGLLVFYNRNKLSEDDMENVKGVLQGLKDDQEKLGITGLVNVFDAPGAEGQLISKDETTMLAQFTYERNGRDIQKIVDELETRLEDCKVEHYITGGAFIANDFLKQTNKGVEKSAVITVAFILIVLIIMFRSVVTPLVSLLTVGIAYLTSMGIVGQLIERLGFPVTSLTQMFIILILFGIGTDYNILLYNRFKEELLNHTDIDDAIIATFKTAGKTVVYSSVTVFFAFLSLSFVKFGVYRSGVAVAVAIVVLVVLLMTLTPVMFKLLGGKLFWPSKANTGHKPSKVWEAAAGFSIKRPYIAMIAILLLVIPMLLVGSYKLSFDNLKDMGGDAPSVIGFNTVSEHFSKGTTMPTTIVIKNKNPMDTSESLAVIDNITNKLKKIEGISEVQGPTQPLGDEIADYYTGNQIGKVMDGLEQADDGIGKIGDGLSTIQEKLAAPDLSQVSQLVDGTGKIQGGMLSLTDGIKQIHGGIEKQAGGADQVSDGIDKIRTNLTTMETSLNQMVSGYSGLEMGFTAFGKNYKDMEQGIQGLIQLSAGISQALGQISPEDKALAEIKKQADLLNTSLVQLDEGFKTLNTNYDNTLSKLTEINGGLKKLSEGLTQVVGGLEQLSTGQKALAEGLKKTGAGQKQIADNMQKLTAGLGSISSGQAKMTEGLSTLGSSFEQLKNGLAASGDGLAQISDGIVKSNEFLSRLSSNKTINIPEEAFENSDFQKALDVYMSKDRKIVKLNVVLKEDPYSDEAIAAVKEINKQLPEMLNGTVISGSEFAAGGETSATNDIQDVAVSDMRLAQFMVLMGIFIVLVLIIKSFWIPVYIIGALVLSFYSAISITSLCAKAFLNTDQLAWNVPFFGFVMIVALGVDYSIFLMTRYREYGDMGPKEAMIKASANVGGVVLSAALILGGTFATLAPSGIKTLVELAVCVCVGVFFLSVILLPLVIPSLISVEDKLVRKYSRYGRSM
ncbi:MAG: MmpL protein [Eubacterium sp.]|nr:MmpL protein [Eubacterium sp.]